MNDYLNPQAMPFRPGGGSNDPRPMSRSRNENYPPPPPMMPPFGFPGAPWHPNFPPPPPPPPHFFAHNQYPYNDFEAHQQAQAHEQARAYHSHWAQNNAPPGLRAPFPPYAPPPVRPQQHYPPHFPQQHHQPPRQPGFAHPAHFAAIQQANWPQGATNEELQYAFNALIKGLKSKNRSANTFDRTPSQPPKKSKKSKAKAKAAASGEDSQQEYGSLHRVDPLDMCTSRIDKVHSTPPPAKAGKKGKYGDQKIMLPAPQPTGLYLSQAAEEASSNDALGDVLVILDLNGTVLFRPNKNAKTMIARPYLKPFLHYLFQNFKVMVWSSAKPVNVKSLVEQALDKDLRSMLVATWARDTFGLSATNFNQNVQVYKNLKLIWSRDQIQQHHPKYEAGERFGQHNTVLIDDSALKASAQPHNLLEIPEFEATPEQMESDDVLREVAGYLEMLRQQADVSKFISKHPFKADGRWNFDWPNEAAGGGDMTDKVTLKVKRPTPAARVSDMTDTLSSVSLGGAAPKKA
jgi:hypothetical protein|tara:strand:- start:3753 stop:5306 length:1554 start_codon:yes stop_codon:yes gene_type:complete